MLYVVEREERTPAAELFISGDLKPKVMALHGVIVADFPEAPRVVPKAFAVTHRLSVRGAVFHANA